MFLHIIKRNRLKKFQCFSTITKNDVPFNKISNVDENKKQQQIECEEKLDNRYRSNSKNKRITVFKRGCAKNSR